ncbi:unnamed protein product, partial [Candidula unifasciata]
CPAITQPQGITKRFLDDSRADACSIAGGVVGIRDSLNDTIFCSGVMISSNTLLVPQDCSDYFKQVLQVPDLTHLVNVGGQRDIVITKENFNSVSRGDGMASIQLPESVQLTSCPEYACLYDSATMRGRVNFGDCFSLSYGNQDSEDRTYSGQVDKMKISDMITYPCCDVLMDAVKSQPNGTYPDTVVNQDSTTICMGSTDSTCAGDFGSPVYCQTFDTNEVVLVAVITSAPCEAGVPILANDLTNGDVTAYFTG